MKKVFHPTTKRICRAGVIAALYVALTYCFGMMSYVGLFQIRPAEAMCLLPLFYPEAIPALFVGCMLANILSLYGIIDIFGGSAVTLVAALLTYLIGRIFREENDKKSVLVARIGLGGLFPVLLNALVIPLIIVYAGGFTDLPSALSVYGWNFLSLLISQSLWIYGLGTPLCFFLRKMRRKNVPAFSDRKPKREADPASQRTAQQPIAAQRLR